MNTKKAQWLSKGEDIKKTLHTLSYRGTGSNSVFFTLGETETLTFSVETDMGYAFLFLHTDREYIAIKEDCISVRTLKHHFVLPLDEPVTLLRCVKEGPEIRFFSAEREILRAEDEAYRGSCSVGLLTEGCSKAVLEVF